MLDQFVEYNDLDKSGDQIIQCGADIRKAISSLTAVVEALQGNWQDEAFTKFRTQYEAKRESLERIAQNLNKYGELAKEQCQKYMNERGVL